jgi:hypothetical protein
MKNDGKSIWTQEDEELEPKEICIRRKPVINILQ